jgi:S1-C subfamily serine protease
MKVRPTLVLVVAASLLGMSGFSLSAQQMMIQAEGAVVAINLPDGRAALITMGEKTPVVTALMGSAALNAAVIDLARGDAVIAIGGKPLSTVEVLAAALDGIAAGGEVWLETQRGNRKATLRFNKPVEPSGGGRRTIIEDTTGAIAAAVAPTGWVTSAEATGTRDFRIAGSVIRQDGPLLNVIVREAHPAAASVRLMVGDQITSIDGTTVSSLAELRDLYGGIASGSTVTLAVTRRGTNVVIRFVKVAAG